MHVIYYCFHRHYDINPGVQLVCKYLNAHKNRADKKKGINKLYNERCKFIVTLCSFKVQMILLLAKSKVSFIDDPKVSYDQCHNLLKEYMPPHVNANKVLQHLFIKYVVAKLFSAFLYVFT